MVKRIIGVGCSEIKREWQGTSERLEEFRESEPGGHDQSTAATVVAVYLTPGFQSRLQTMEDDGRRSQVAKGLEALSLQVPARRGPS